MAQDPQAGFRTLVADAEAHFHAGRFAEAASAYRAALALSPGHGVTVHNLGVALAGQGDHRSAISCFDAALAADPDYVSAHYNRAVACLALDDTQDAIRGLRRVCALEPQHYEAHRALGFLWLVEGNRERALDHLARTYELRRGDDRTAIAIKSLTCTTRDKLAHDAEQFRYLSAHVRDGRRFEGLARTYQAVANELPEGIVTLSPEQIDDLGEGYNTAIHIRSAPELPGRAVSQRSDYDLLKQEFEQTGAVYFDDLLTSSALARLKQYLLESTIWHDFTHIDGFVASYLEDGLACPLVLQIADEIRATFPDLLAPHPLTQAWAFKGLRAGSAVDVHADDAAISVNFWVTPTEANLKPGRGGLTVCRVPPPADWTIEGYEEDQERGVAFLEQNAGNSLVVPYGENRAVLFRSRLIHASDAPNFADGYENHRTNITLLYGAASAA